MPPSRGCKTRRTVMRWRRGRSKTNTLRRLHPTASLDDRSSLMVRILRTPPCATVARFTPAMRLHAESQSESQQQPVRRSPFSAGFLSSRIGGLGGTPSTSSSSSLSSAFNLSVPCPAGFDPVLWRHFTAQPSPVAIPLNSIKLAYLHGLLSSIECVELIDLVTGSFRRSAVDVAGSSIVSSVRTSSSAAVSASTPLGRRIRSRIATLTGVDDKQIQDLSVVRYEPGQQFTPHYDSILGRERMRQYTIFVYLNTIDGGGGETEFTQLGVKFKPKRGDALFWENHASRDAESHDESQHAGRPPLSGVKYGLNCWIEFP